VAKQATYGKILALAGIDRGKPQKPQSWQASDPSEIEIGHLLNTSQNCHCLNQLAKCNLVAANRCQQSQPSLTDSSTCLNLKC